MTMPAVSLILPTCNRPKLLAEAIDSINTQTYSGTMEVIIADDGSLSPVTLNALPSCKFEIQILRNTASKGGAAAKNLGVNAAQGEFLLFLDDDDLLSPGYVEDAITTLLSFPQIRILFMSVRWFGERAEWGQRQHDRNTQWILDRTTYWEPEPGIILFTHGLFEALLQRIPMPFQRPVLRRKDFEAIGHYQEDCLLWDCEWALRAVLHGTCALAQKSPYLQRASGQGYSSKASRQEEHLHSMIIAKERLIQHPTCKKDPNYRKSLIFSLADAWFNTAYFYCHQKRHHQAVIALLQAVRWHPEPRQAKLLGRILYQTLIHR